MCHFGPYIEAFANMPLVFEKNTNTARYEVNYESLTKIKHELFKRVDILRISISDKLSAEKLFACNKIYKVCINSCKTISHNHHHNRYFLPKPKFDNNHSMLHAKLLVKTSKELLKIINIGLKHPLCRKNIKDGGDIGV